MFSFSMCSQGAIVTTALVPLAGDGVREVVDDRDLALARDVNHQPHARSRAQSATTDAPADDESQPGPMVSRVCRSLASSAAALRCFA